mgnify:CR=1 FL=1
MVSSEFWSQKPVGERFLSELSHQIPLCERFLAEFSLEKSSAEQFLPFFCHQEWKRNECDTALLSQQKQKHRQADHRTVRFAPFGVLRLKPEYKIWSRDRALNAKIRRKGFEVVPEFGGTAHAYCGESLKIATGDLLEWDRFPTLDSMLRAFIIKSRVSSVENLLIVQPYSPALFNQGVLPGPDLLLRKQRREISLKELKHLWKEHE